MEDDTNRPLWLSKGWSLNRGDRLIEVKITVIVLDLWQPTAWHGCRLIQVRLFKFYLIRGWNQVKKLFWLLDCIEQYSEITETYFGVKWTKCHLPLSNKVTWKPTLFPRRLQFRPPLKMMKCPWKYWNIIHASVSKSCITQLLQLMNSFEINQTICADKLSYCVTMALWSSVKNLHKVSLIVK